MTKTSSFQKPLRALCSIVVLVGAYACAAAVDPVRGSETHFLARCSAACGGGLECIDGVCTRACQVDGECTSLSAGATCVSGASGSASCRVACSVDEECRSHNDAWACASASCVGSPRLLSSAGQTASTLCPTFAGGVQQPSDTAATFAAVPDANDVQWVHADEAGVYWIDLEGAIHTWSEGAAGSTILRPAPTTPGTRLGLTGDAARLYWTEAAAYPPGPNEPGPPPPPARVLAMARNGGTPELLVESASTTLTPVGVDPAGRLFVISAEGSLNEVSAPGALDPVANVPRTPGGDLQLVDGQAYWSQYEGEQRFLYTVNPGRGQPVRLSELDSDGYASFIAGRGVVLWTPSDLRLDPLVLEQHFVMLNENTGCLQDLPSVDLSIGQTVIDEQPVYWHSFNALAPVSPAGPEPSISLLRVDLRTGRFEQVSTPSMAAVAGGDLLAQNDSTIYVRVNPGGFLFALRKPD